MSPRHASRAATATVVLTAAIVLVVAYWSLPMGEWAYVDRPFDPDKPARVGQPLEEDLPLEVGINVPETGIGRIDLRFAVFDGSPLPPEAPPEGAVVNFSLEADSGAKIWESLLSVSDLSPDGTALVFPEVTRGATSAVRLRVEAQGLGSRTRVALWEVPCDCSALISGHRQVSPGGRFAAMESDPDATVYSRVVGRIDRFRLALHRVDGIHPTGFGKWAVLTWATGAFIAALVLTWYLGFLLVRTEASIFRDEATIGRQSEGPYIDAIGQEPGVAAREDAVRHARGAGGHNEEAS